jgi:hypothetical protein
MNEKQPLMEPSATSRPGARQTISAWPLDCHRIWQELTGKQLWIDAIMAVIVQIILTACFLRVSPSFVALYHMVFPFVPVFIATKLIFKPLLDSLFGSFFGRRFPRLRARQPNPPSYRLDLKPEECPEFRWRTTLPTLPLLPAALEKPGCDL